MDDKINILLIDDNKEKLIAIRSILDMPDLNLIECNSGAEGLKQLLRHEFALILLDVNMPGMDGFETARWIRENPPTELTPIIFFTGYSSDEMDVATGYGQGAVDFIFTPIRPIVLRTKVQAFVDLYKKTKKIEQQKNEVEQLRDHLEEMVAKRTHALETSLKEKEILLSEIHHRVKNNLAVVSALLELEMDHLKDDKVKEILVNSVSRVKSMAIIHEKLYDAGNFSHLEFNRYIKDLVDKISMAYINTYKKITFQIEAPEEVHLNLNQAIPCALLLNELLINAYKHAFKDRKKGKIQIRISEKDNRVELRVKDDGVGLPDDFHSGKVTSLGIDLVNTWVRQLEATMDVKNANGSTFTINFPKSDQSGASNGNFE
ncbi:MAG: histidine kinase dimerization/phosphoacceptor domain -containing protein [Balneolales bacterium]